MLGYSHDMRYSPAMPSRVKIFFDGGCRPNPGEMEIAIVVGGNAHVRRNIGHGTSMDAEWLALIEALRLAQQLDLREFILLGDSAAVIAQASGKAKCRGADNENHLRTYTALASALGKPRVRHIKRSQNLAGIALSQRYPRPAPC